MSKSSQKYHKNKRKGSRWLQTKRSPKNKNKWEKQVGHANRLKYRKLWSKFKTVFERR